MRGIPKAHMSLVVSLVRYVYLEFIISLTLHLLSALIKEEVNTLSLQTPYTSIRFLGGSCTSPVNLVYYRLATHAHRCPYSFILREDSYPQFLQSRLYSRPKRGVGYELA